MDFHFVLSNVKDNPSAVERSMLEHAYANRNMGMYVKNQEEYLASKRAERVRERRRLLGQRKRTFKSNCERRQFSRGLEALV